MYIAGKSGPINMLGLQLGSVGTNFRLVMQPFSPEDSTNTWQTSNDMLIRFEDSRELDTFIYALQKFRAKNQKYIGDWVEEEFLKGE